MTALKQIYNNINAGKKYGYMMNNVKYPFFDVVLSANQQYIYWRHFGSSANKNTVEDLEWILENIFKLSPEKFIEKYECREV